MGAGLSETDRSQEGRRGGGAEAGIGALVDAAQQQGIRAEAGRIRIEIEKEIPSCVRETSPEKEHVSMSEETGRDRRLSFAETAEETQDA